LLQNYTTLCVFKLSESSGIALET